jgi:hypothetical protein
VAHATGITARLPPLYAQGPLLREVVDHPALALEILDEDLIEVRRAHWFDHALELEEAAGLAALLGFAAEPWQDLAEFRAWVHAMRTAILEHGSTGVRALQVFVEEYLRRVVAASPDVLRLLAATPGGARTGTTPGSWSSVANPAVPSFVENPQRLHGVSLGALAPLRQVVVHNAGLDPADAGVLMVGLPAGPEYVPVLVNLDTGQAVAYLGAVPPGERLWLRSDGTAQLEHRDVTAALRSIATVTPGTPWSAADVELTPRALRLQPGDNRLWFLPVAHYDAPGLDRVLLALATLDLRQGVFDETRFDNALFDQPPAVAVSLAWRETTPATVDLTLPAGLLLARRDHTDDALALRTDTADALHRGVDTLAAAGVHTTVTLAPFAETQPHRDHQTGRLPLHLRERAPTGSDRDPAPGALFDLTPFGSYWA